MALRNPFTRLVLTARRLARERKGAGAIEFAILFPVLIMLYIGAFEITIGLSVSKRVTRAAGTIADIVTQRFNYELDLLGIALTAVVIVGYFAFLLIVSEKEYKQVIAEKFD